MSVPPEDERADEEVADSEANAATVEGRGDGRCLGFFFRLFRVVRVFLGFIGFF